MIRLGSTAEIVHSRDSCCEQAIAQACAFSPPFSGIFECYGDFSENGN